ncbi:MAG: DUF3530 family protein [Gammaproteobacteria bacterium]
MRLFLILVLSTLFSVNALALEANLEREARLKSQIIDAILDGEGIDLEADGQEFLAIDMEPDDEPKGGIILLHGRGYHPDWAQAIQPLRVGLANAGWRTLSLQMPVLGKAAKYFDYIDIFPAAIPRIEAGIEYLKEQGIKHIVLIAHSCGGHMAIHWINKKGADELSAFVGIGIGATDYQQPMQEKVPYQSMDMPILDVIAKEDYPAVLRMAPGRRSMLTHVASKQITIDGSDHYHTDNGDALVEAVETWLEGLDFWLKK